MLGFVNEGVLGCAAHESFDSFCFVDPGIQKEWARSVGTLLDS